MDNKWWEYYAIRYFVGTVVGAGIVAYLNYTPGSPYEASLLALSDFKDATFTGVSLFAAIGFAFCYVASAPILLLHATREHLRFTGTKTHGGLLLLALAASIALAVWAATTLLPSPAAWAVGVPFGIQLYLLGRTFMTKFADVEAFYRTLAKARATESPTNPPTVATKTEYVTSYRHLREHGNAFLIIVLEAALGYALFKVPSPSCAFPLLVAWIAPASVVWLVGTVLETRFARDATFP